MTQAKAVEVELDGQKYKWNGRRWLTSNNLTPPKMIMKRLDELIASGLSAEDSQITNVYVLAERAREARENRQLGRAEELARRMLQLDPTNGAGAALLCAVLRDQGMPKLALAHTAIYQHLNHLPLLTSRAAALCDIGEWKEAKKVIGRVLAMQKSEEAFNVVMRIKAARPELYP